MDEDRNLLNLPTEILEKVLSFLSFDEIAKNRLVCRSFNATCGQLLNRGFLNIERRHSVILKKVKALLPRRESERRVHQFARHSDILTTVDTRISMLRMTFMKYIELKACCFIPGKVIDEINRILTLVETTCSPPRTHEVLQELRDISSMAMEYFDEKIVPSLKMQRAYMSNYTIPGLSSFPPPVIVKDTLRKEFNVLQHRNAVQRQQISILKHVVRKLTARVNNSNGLIKKQSRKLREQSAKLNQQDVAIADLKRQVDEWDMKFKDMIKQMSRVSNGTSQHKTPSNQKQSTTCTITNTSPTDSTIRFYKPNIKPRTALPRSVSRVDLDEIERKRKPATSISSLTPIPPKLSRMDFFSSQLETNRYDNTLSLAECRPLIRKSGSLLADLPRVISSSLESLVKSPISSIKSRKRKLQ